jgi:hypothetical protein
MSTTFRPIAAVTANSASKAIVRGALDEFLRSRSADLNSVYFYFPGYELVTTLFSNAFQPDGRHLYAHVIDAVMHLFASVYTTTHFASSVTDWPQWKAALGSDATAAALDRELAELKLKYNKLSRANELSYRHVRRLKRRLMLPRLENWLRRWKKGASRLRHRGA